AFPLFFLVLFSLGRIAGPLALAGVALWAVLAPLISREQWTLEIGEILGPLVGAVFSLIAHAVHRRLLVETDRNRKLVAQLQAAQSELADSERRKGIAEERQRLAQGIHDTLAQGLNSSVLLSRSARGAHPEAAESFSRIEGTARDNLADARRLVRDLADRAPRTTLEQALRSAISRAEALAETPRWELRIDGTPRKLPPAQVETLHRAAQSLIANVQQHAGADRCVLTLAWWPGRVSLDVVDDGCGFDPDATTTGPDGGNGLRRLRTRLARAGGSVAIDSAPGVGTTVGLTLPSDAPELDAPEADEGMQVAAEVGSGTVGLHELARLAAAPDGAPDLVLMDLNLGDGIGGIDPTRRLRAAHADVQVLAVTTFDAEADIDGALEAG